MTCGSCAAKVSARLIEHPDVATATVTVNPPEAKLSTRTPLSEQTINEWLLPLGKYRVPKDDAPVEAPATAAAPAKNAQTYRPLLVLLGYLLAVTLIVASPFHWMTAMNVFMGGFFIAFSFFKMLDLRGFADAYRSYDLVAKAVPAYGFVYPFIELVLGLAYLARWQPALVNAVTAVVMAVSLAGVLRAVLSKQTIRCACLGTVFNLPMSTVTIVEDGVMLAMALVGLVAVH
ncbi:MAG: hypothetical protein JWO08_2855 [Verrucomicrobiaceae bacterium]|nr:hypothetical protein [Verrucomicrobiaceae bacterium]